jgi:hypothetical protein
LITFSGSYGSDEIRVVFDISVKDGALSLVRPKASPLKLLPTFPDYFRGSRIGSFHFLRNSAGQVTGFSLYSQRSRNLLFTRIADTDAQHF